MQDELNTSTRKMSTTTNVFYTHWVIHINNINVILKSNY